jgi:hypothetical protein
MKNKCERGEREGRGERVPEIALKEGEGLLKGPSDEFPDSSLAICGKDLFSSETARAE